MSYSITVKTVDGVPTVISHVSVPDGTHQISGHEDADRRDLSVYRTGPDGGHVANVSTSHRKES